jgi:hypothetical protein
MFSIRDVVNHALRVLDETQFENGMTIFHILFIFTIFVEDIPAITFLTEKEHFRNYKVQDIIGTPFFFSLFFFPLLFFLSFLFFSFVSFSFLLLIAKCRPKG